MPTLLEEAAEYVNGLTDEFLQDCGPEFQRLAMYATVILSELNGRRDTPSEKHCAWCDGEGRCAGITLGSVCLNGADTSPEAVNAMAFRLATIEAYPFTSAKETMQRGAVMIRALAAQQAQSDERIRELTEALQGFVRWANAKCPCENEQPNPCPLCGASIFEGCKAADQTLPRDLLAAARAALAPRGPR